MFVQENLIVVKIVKIYFKACENKNWKKKKKYDDKLQLKCKKKRKRNTVHQNKMLKLWNASVKSAK